MNSIWLFHATYVCYESSLPQNMYRRDWEHWRVKCPYAHLCIIISPTFISPTNLSRDVERCMRVSSRVVLLISFLEITNKLVVTQPHEMKSHQKRTKFSCSQWKNSNSSAFYMESVVMFDNLSSLCLPFCKTIFLSLHFVWSSTISFSTCNLICNLLVNERKLTVRIVKRKKQFIVQ